MFERLTLGERSESEGEMSPSNSLFVTGPDYAALAVLKLHPSASSSLVLGLLACIHHRLKSIEFLAML